MSRAWDWFSEKVNDNRSYGKFTMVLGFTVGMHGLLVDEWLGIMAGLVYLGYGFHLYATAIEIPKRNRFVVCPACRGRGQFTEHAVQCMVCDGAGALIDQPNKGGTA